MEYRSPHVPMTDEDVYNYVNGRIAIKKIRNAMKTGDIKKGIWLGHKLLVQRRAVDQWLDEFFSQEKQTTMSGYDILPVELVNGEQKV